MKAIIILLTLNMSILPLFAHQNEGDITYSSKKLEDIASLLPKKYLIDRDSIMTCPEICQNKSFVIEFNDKHQVSHLGISMFSKEIKVLINEPVCNFVERILLELAVASEQKAVLSMLDHFGIVLLKNGRKFGEGNLTSITAILNEIEDPVRFALSKDDKSYTFFWEYGRQNIFAIQFPLNRELITGTNKLEADNLLFDQLKGNNCANQSIHTNYQFEDADLITKDSVVFVRKGDSFVLSAINENTYYKKTADGYELIFDEKYPNESLSNVFMQNIDNNQLKIHITYSMYGNYNPEFEMKLNDFICFFKKDFKVYAVTYQKEPDVVQSTVIFQNKQYNYIHLLMIRAKKENIFQGNGILSASFRSNIPQHNINNLMGDILKNINHE